VPSSEPPGSTPPDGTPQIQARGKRLCVTSATVPGLSSGGRRGYRVAMVADQRLQILLEQGEELGCLNLSAVNEFLQEADLDDGQVEGFFEPLEERHIALTDDCARADATESTYVNGDLAVATTDALQLFLNEAGRYKLLTAQEEVELAKRIERGDKAAKDLM